MIEEEEEYSEHELEDMVDLEMRRKANKREVNFLNNNLEVWRRVLRNKLEESTNQYSLRKSELDADVITEAEYMDWKIKANGWKKYLNDSMARVKCKIQEQINVARDQRTDLIFEKLDNISELLEKLVENQC